jgi:hypothetical protein
MVRFVHFLDCEYLKACTEGVGCLSSVASSASGHSIPVLQDTATQCFRAQQPPNAPGLAVPSYARTPNRLPCSPPSGLGWQSSELSSVAAQPRGL